MKNSIIITSDILIYCPFFLRRFFYFLTLFYLFFHPPILTLCFSRFCFFLSIFVVPSILIKEFNYFIKFIYLKGCRLLIFFFFLRKCYFVAFMIYNLDKISLQREKQPHENREQQFFTGTLEKDFKQRKKE